MTIIVYHRENKLITEFPENDDACAVRVTMLSRALQTKPYVLRSDRVGVPKTGLN